MLIGLIYGILAQGKLTTIQAWSESLAYSPDGKKAAVGYGGQISLFNANTGQLQQTFSGDKNGVNSIVFSSDGSMLVSGEYACEWGLEWDDSLVERLNRIQ